MLQIQDCKPLIRKGFSIQNRKSKIQNWYDKIDGNIGNDEIFGDNLNNQEGGDDRLTGGAGNDTLLGGVGNDQLFGGDDNDTLYGDAGNDTLSGSDGSDQGEIDVIIGGTGADRFILGNQEKAFYQGRKDADYANILDFSASERDTLQLHGTRQNYSLKQQGNDTYIRYHDRPQPLDAMLLTDLTKSFRSELATVKQLMPALVEKLQASYQDIQLGVAAFTDVAHDWNVSVSIREPYTELKKVGKNQFGYDQYVEVKRIKTTHYSNFSQERGYTYSQHNELTSDLPMPLEAINHRLEIFSAGIEGILPHTLTAGLETHKQKPLALGQFVVARWKGYSTTCSNPGLLVFESRAESGSQKLTCPNQSA